MYRYGIPQPIWQQIGSKTLITTTKVDIILLTRASNDFGASQCGIQTIKMGFNHFLMFVTFQYRGLHHLDMYCTLITEAWLQSNIHFDCRYLELWNTCIINLVLIVLNVRGGTESKYPSIVFMSILALLWFKVAQNYKIFVWQINNLVCKGFFTKYFFDLILYVPVNYFSVMSGLVFLG